MTEYKFYVGFKDIDSDLKLKNSSMLTFFENIAGIHADMMGDGFNLTVNTTNTTWLLLYWKVKVIKRPVHGESVIARTWVRDFKRYYSYRQFELLSEKGELLAVCASKWVKINFKTGLPERHAIGTEKYQIEPFSNFGQENPEVKIAEPAEYNFEYTCRVPLDWIDMNYHMNNTRYLNLVHCAFAETGHSFAQWDDFEILYKKEVKYGDTVRCLVSEDADGCTAVIKSADGSVLHALVKFYR